MKRNGFEQVIHNDWISTPDIWSLETDQVTFSDLLPNQKNRLKWPVSVLSSSTAELQSSPCLHPDMPMWLQKDMWSTAAYSVIHTILLSVNWLEQRPSTNMMWVLMPSLPDDTTGQLSKSFNSNYMIRSTKCVCVLKVCEHKVKAVLVDWSTLKVVSLHRLAQIRSHMNIPV